MPTECISDLFGFARVESRRVEAAFDGGAVTSNGGAFLLGATERAIGLVVGFARCFQDGRDPALTEHSVATLVGQRVFALALGYEDLIDHDELRHDPVMAVLAGKLEARRADCAPLAGKSTLNRLEHAPSGAPSRYHKIGHDAAAIERQFVALFLAAHRRPAKQIIIDLDATDDPLHGEQEDRFFHGHYDCYCYLPLYIFCGRHLLAAKLRPANIDGAAGAIEELARIVEQIRDDWPDVRILVRADSGFAREALIVVRSQPGRLRLWAGQEQPAQRRRTPSPPPPPTAGAPASRPPLPGAGVDDKIDKARPTPIRASSTKMRPDMENRIGDLFARRIGSSMAYALLGHYDCSPCFLLKTAVGAPLRPASVAGICWQGEAAAGQYRRRRRRDRGDLPSPGSSRQRRCGDVRRRVFAGGHPRRLAWSCVFWCALIPASPRGAELAWCEANRVALSQDRPRRGGDRAPVRRAAGRHRRPANADRRRP